MNNYNLCNYSCNYSNGPVSPYPLPGVPDEMTVLENQGGIVMGWYQPIIPLKRHVGIPYGAEGNVILIGGPGSGKTTSTFIPTLSRYWKGPFFAVDIKGDLYGRYNVPASENKHPVVVLDISDSNSLSVDPFEWLALGGEDDLLSKTSMMAGIFCPTAESSLDPFWVQSEQAVLTAVLLGYFQMGLSFPEAITRALDLKLSELCKELLSLGDTRIRHLIGSMDTLKPETVASIERGLRNRLLPLANEQRLMHFFRGVREEAPVFSLTEFESSRVFLKIPQEYVEQWGPGINLLLTMLLSKLELRPEVHSPEAEGMEPYLVAIDEFPRFGNLPTIRSSLATLRSKSVNLLLAVQSLAQLDSVYGSKDRAAILDCCSYRIVLQVSDPQDQHLISSMIGTQATFMPSYGVSWSPFPDQYGCFPVSGYTSTLSMSMQPIVKPEDLASLKVAVLCTPFGTFFVSKINPRLFPPVNHHPAEIPDGNGIITMVSVDERSQRAESKVKGYLNGTAETLAMSPKALAQTHGQMLQRYFPDFLEPDADTGKLETVMWVLATKPDLVQSLVDQAEKMIKF